MAITKKEVIDWLNNQSVIEISSLVKDLEKQWGINANTFNVASSSNDQSIDKPDKSKEKSSFDVLLKSFGKNKISVIKEIRSITGLGLKESKDLVESAPKIIKEGISKEESEEIQNKLKAAGAIIEIK